MNPGGFGCPAQKPPGVKPLPPEGQDPFLLPLHADREDFRRAAFMGYPRVGEDGALILGPWAERERFWGGGGPGPCPPSDKVSPPPLPLFFRVGPHSWGLRLGGRANSRPPRPEGPRLRRSMRGSDLRLLRALEYLERAGAEPTHLLTLTIPVSTWGLLPKARRPRAYARARHWFFMRFSQHVRKRYGFTLDFVRWDEFTRRGVPHVHALLDLRTCLPRPEWEHLARQWIPDAWKRALQRAGFPIRKAPRTRLECLEHPDMRYAKAYAAGGVKGSGGKKAYQRRYPYEGAWGRSWDVGGAWRALLREARWEDYAGPDVVRVRGDALDLLVVWSALDHLEAPISLRADLLPAVQVVAGPEPGAGEVLRRRVGRFWRSSSHRALVLEALALADVLQRAPPSP